MKKFGFLFACAIAFAGCGANQNCKPCKPKAGGCKKSQNFTCDPKAAKHRKQRSS